MCCPTFAKVLLIIFNLIFFVIGIALFAVGIWTVTDPYKLDILAILDNPVVANTAYILIVLGVFIVIVSFLGCCGAWKKNKCMLIMYFVIVLVIFLVQFIACCVAVAYKEKVDEFVKDELGDSMDKYKRPWDDDNKYNLAWNGIQFLLECCGTNSSADWEPTPFAGSMYMNKNWTYPPSCCKVDDPYNIVDGKYPKPKDTDGCVSSPSKTNMNSDGCYEAFEDWVVDNALYVGGTGLGLAFLEIFCMVFAMCIYCDVRKQDEIA
ncbi:tetraspanin-1-like [Anneissia japonica]|uniref:tetraspanin-1-like n=1 Tax=Anneissia japonica TaxID=1529436 RepID=UPI0014259D0A|nr:tetraspanin-1-like [Anneissia japonica]